MLAKGPACTKTGVSSRVCMRVGMIASFIRTATAPAERGKRELDVFFVVERTRGIPTSNTEVICGDRITTPAATNHLL